METHRVDPFSFFIYEFIIWVLLSVLWNCHLWQKEPPQGSCCVWKNSIDGAALSSSKAEGRSLQEPSDSTPAAFQCDRLSPAVPQKKLQFILSWTKSLRQGFHVLVVFCSHTQLCYSLSTAQTKLQWLTLTCESALNSVAK